MIKLVSRKIHCPLSDSMLSLPIGRIVTRCYRPRLSNIMPIGSTGQDCYVSLHMAPAGAPLCLTVVFMERTAVR